MSYFHFRYLILRKKGFFLKVHNGKLPIVFTRKIPGSNIFKPSRFFMLRFDCMQQQVHNFNLKIILQSAVCVRRFISHEKIITQNVEKVDYYSLQFAIFYIDRHTAAPPYNILEKIELLNINIML